MFFIRSSMGQRRKSAMSDQIIDAVMAHSLHLDAYRTHLLPGWVVMQDPPGYPDKVVARLVTDAPSPYLLMADTLAGIHEQLPPHLVRLARQPADPPEVVEIWCPV
jgi:hypothetical protein